MSDKPRMHLSIKIQVSCLLCVQGRIGEEVCPQCGGNMHWEQEMPLERAVLMFRDYLQVAERAEFEAKKAKRQAKKSSILLMGEA